MAEDTTIQAQEVPVSESQGAPMPSADQQPTQDVAQDSEVLPEGVKERTTQEFEKLRSQLREEKARRQYVESVFQTLQTQQQPKQVETPSIIDPDTGLPREDVLNDVQRRALEAEQRATKAEQTVTQYMQEQEDRAVYAAHPDVNPNAKEFNQELHNLTSALMLSSMVKPESWGGQLSFMDATAKAKDIFAKGADSARKEGAQQALDQLTPKEQAALAAESNTSARQELSGNLEELSQRTRKGDLDAIVERMKRAS